MDWLVSLGIYGTPLLTVLLGYRWAARTDRSPWRWGLGLGALVAVTIYVALVIAALAVLSRTEF